ncbi:MT-A70 family methyltransferase [Pararhizobium sp. LjRoot238]|uniref:MT-A70 family methyltransferase n=1 Tax=Pararhizobium sp. LjRoot238 TaxID=3342293 RepID=UPI003ECD87A9
MSGKMDMERKAKSWRDVVKIHPAADLFPMLDPEQLDQLAADIQKNGLLQPVTIYAPSVPSCEPPVLVDGRNRLDALERLGKIRIRDGKVQFEGWNPGQWLSLSHATNVVKLDSELACTDPYAYVASLNVHRRHLSREQQREVIAKMLAANPAISDRRIGKVVGVDGKTVGAVRDAMERRAEIPHVSIVTDTKGRQQPVDREARQFIKAERRAQRESALAVKITALPGKRYGVILADPPWRFEPYSRETGMDRAADNHYPTMHTTDIADLGRNPPAARECALFLWATAPMMPDALKVMMLWGFQYKSQIIWNKGHIGTGYWVRNAHEHLLIGTRGNIPAPAPGEQPQSVIAAPRGVHSAKPEVFYDIIERMFPSLPKIELFARSARKGWDRWGNEAPPSPITQGCPYPASENMKEEDHG